MTNTLRFAVTLAVACAGGLLAGCGEGLSADKGRTTTAGRTFTITPGESATADMEVAMTLASVGDTIEFACGYFDLATTLQLINTEDIRIRGCGKDATVLSFARNNLPEGILAVNVGGLVIEDLTVLDTAGNGIELRAVNNAQLRRVRTMWSSNGGRTSPDRITAANYKEEDSKRLHVACTDPATQDPKHPENAGGDTSSPDYTVSDKSGRYGIYPVSSDYVLIEDAESVGASDAGIYVGQTNKAIIRNSRAAFNVFGFEIENVQDGEYDGNLAECNTGGFLVYDLDNLRQYGDRSRMHGNVSRNNNTYNFTSGGFVANVPPGSGMITLSYDRIDVFGNTFENNNTGGIIHASYELFPASMRPSEKRIDWYTEGVHIFGNTFRNNGNGLPPPKSGDLAAQDLARLLPALVGAKNQAACALPENAAACAAAGGNTFRGAHIVWDGLLDAYDAGCPYPKDAAGNDVPKDERGKPLHTNEHPDPACHYNAYKFDTTQAGNPRKVPAWFASCIDADNDFSADSLAFSNFNGTKGLNAVIALSDGAPPTPEQIAEIEEFPASFDMSAHDCPTAYGENLPLLPAFEIPPFVRTGAYDAAPSEKQVEKLCRAKVGGDEVNFAAAAVNCPDLAQYNLFEDAEDPTSAPNGGGVPFSMNSKLFSDYAVKYRVAFLPPGTQATYKDHNDSTSATLTFPTGTIVAKTFSFRDEAQGTEVPVETRLLIKRESSGGRVRWDGVAYLWKTVDGKRVAELSLTGATVAAHWDLTDVDSGERYTGSTESYRVPNVNQCLSCHSNADKEAGAAPIGLKVRNLNGPYRPESAQATLQSQHAVRGRNQLQFWRDEGLLAGGPADFGVEPTTQVATALERLPIYNKPGDAGHEAGSPADVESRARAWLEVNCEHCHTVRGYAGSTGLYLDSFREVDVSYGICKSPTATGAEGSGGRAVDIHPGDSTKSIMEYRISEAATTPSARMPPIARSVVDEAGHALIQQWIDEVVDENYKDGDCASLVPLPEAP
jgi:parallel beta-helix repeat protein